MIIEFMGQFINLITIGAIKVGDGIDNEGETVYCIVVLNAAGQAMTEFVFYTVKERDKAYKKLSTKIRKVDCFVE